MTKGAVSEMSDEDLVNQYAALSEQQGRALRLLVSSTRVNRIGDIRSRHTGFEQ
jgi:hypothetical protein